MDLKEFVAEHTEAVIVLEAGDAWHSVTATGDGLEVRNGDEASDIGLDTEDLDEMDNSERAELQDALGGIVDAAYKTSKQNDED